MNLLQFAGGQALVSYSVDQANDTIQDVIGLGPELYRSEKQVQMLEDPVTFLQERNTALNNLKADIQQGPINPLTNNRTGVSLYQTTLDRINDSLGANYASFRDSSWVKGLAVKQAAYLAKLKKDMIDIQYPVVDRAIKRQKKANKAAIKDKVTDLKMGME